MPTDEERREVAESLRIMTAYGCRYAEQFYELLQETIMREFDFHSFTDVADRLADLIEPEPERTCKFIPFIEDDGSIFVENCSECDAAVLSRCEFNYCPKCGAKVIDDER